VAHERPAVLFAYFGRRGALSQITLDLARTAAVAGPMAPLLAVSRQNEAFDAIVATGVPVLPVDTFDSGPSLVVRTLLAPLRLARLVAAARAADATWVVTLMPHAWSPLLRRAAQAAGLRYAVIVHDGAHHPGDGMALVDRWWAWEARRADRVITWSLAVAERLVGMGVAPERISPLYHPVPAGYVREGAPAPAAAGPLRLLFFGRIRLYKGLRLLLDAHRILAGEGRAITLSIVGDGDLAPYADGLDQPGVTVDNRWIGHEEVPELIAEHDVVVLPYLEASQSGVIPAAFAAGRPVVVTPVDGLVEQVRDGVNGVVAGAATAEALADALRRLAADPALLATCTAGARDSVGDWTMDRFLGDLWTALGPHAPARD
jgi:glycosyltransferase involved in cell wall biosynthesis